MKISSRSSSEDNRAPRRAVPILTLLSVSALTAYGAISTNVPETFDGGIAGWEVASSSGTVSIDWQTNAVAGGAGAFLEITLTYGLPPAPLDPTISNAPSFADDYTRFGKDLELRFDFYAADEEVASFPSLVLETGSGQSWTHSFATNGMPVGSWLSYVIPIPSNGAGWTKSGGAEDFWTAITNVASLGLNMEGHAFAGGTQKFGIDNIEFRCLETTNPVVSGVATNIPDSFTTGVGNWGSSEPIDVPLAWETNVVGGGDGAFLGMTFHYGGPPSPLEPCITNGIDFSGDYTGFGDTLILKFDFYAASNPPAVGATAFLDTSDGTRWQYAFDVANVVTGAWFNYAIQITSNASWSGGSSSFWEALTNVVTLGFKLEGNAFAGGDQFFGLDNVEISAAGDYDGDNMEDEWEAKFFGTLSRNGNGDFDDDGQTDGDENVAGVDPTNPASLFQIEDFEIPANSNAIVISWGSVTGRTYTLSCTTNLLGNWTNVFTVTGDGARYVVTNDNGPGRFYRLEVER